MRRSSPRPGPDEAQKREKLESAITSYRRAIELGLRDPAVRAALRPAPLPGRAGERGPGVLQPDAGGRPAHRRPGADRLADRPGQSRLPPGRGDREEGGRRPTPTTSRPASGWPRSCWSQGRNDEAEAVIRKAIDAAKADPDRWITPGPVHGADPTSPPRPRRPSGTPRPSLAAAPLALAQCCEMVGKAFELGEPGPGQVVVRPGPRLVRQGPAGDEGPRRPDGQAPPRRVPAADQPGRRRRGAAQGDPRADRRRQVARPWPPGPGAASPRSTSPRNPPRTAEAAGPLRRQVGPTATTPDDLRVLALIHEAQGTPEGRRAGHRRPRDADRPRGRHARGPPPAGPAPGGRRRMAPRPRAVPRADPAGRRRARRRDDRPAAPAISPCSSRPCSATTSPATTPTWPRPGNWSRSSGRSSATRWAR